MRNKAFPSRKMFPLERLHGPKPFGITFVFLKNHIPYGGKITKYDD
jgi:hypothetical protein